MATCTSICTPGDDRETRVRGVRVILRSLPGGPDVSQIAVHFGGGGSATRAFFKAPSTAILESNFEQPEVVLRRVDNDSSCLQLEPKDVVMVMLRDQHFHQDPLEDWSWGFKTSSPKEDFFADLLTSQKLVFLENADRRDGFPHFPMLFT
eukprot:symbB.v1.2.008786.t1/scaffold536.1/size343967/2